MDTSKNARSLVFMHQIPMKYKWNIKDSINIEYRLFAVSEDVHTICRIGCNLMGYQRGKT